MFVLLKNNFSQLFHLVPNRMILVFVGFDQHVPDPLCLAFVDFLIVDHGFNHQ